MFKLDKGLTTSIICAFRLEVSPKGVWGGGQQTHEHCISEYVSNSINSVIALLIR